MKQFELIIPVKSAPLSEWPEKYQSLCRAALTATKNAYAPYSNFHVGAAVLMVNGELVTGSNQENAAYPSGLCAERVALFYAGSLYPDIPVEAIAVAAISQGQVVERISPCGACRQVLLEAEMRSGAPLKIFLCGNDSITLIEKATDLLPFGFDGNDLARNQ